VAGESERWTRVNRVAAIAGILGLVIAIGQIWDPVRRATVDVACWLYPDYLIALLSLLLVGAIGLFLRADRRGRAAAEALGRTEEQRAAAVADAERARAAADPDRVRHDRAALKRLRDVVDRPTITWLRQHHFGEMWRREQVLPLHVLANEHDEVEDRFLD
jgi:hypothetical protein